MASTFKSYAYNCRSLLDLNDSAAEIDGGQINLQDVQRPALGKLGLRRDQNSNYEETYENNKLPGMLNDIVESMCFNSDKAKQNLRTFLISSFRPFGLANELFRVMSNSATARGYNIQNLRASRPELGNKSDMLVQVIPGSKMLVITETVTIHGIQDKSGINESDEPLSIAKCRWVLTMQDNQPIVHLSDTTFQHNSRIAEKAFDTRGILEKLRQLLTRLFTRTKAGIKPLLDTSGKYRYLRHAGIFAPKAAAPAAKAGPAAIPVKR